MPKAKKANKTQKMAGGYNKGKKCKQSCQNGEGARIDKAVKVAKKVADTAVKVGKKVYDNRKKIQKGVKIATSTGRIVAGKHKDKFDAVDSAVDAFAGLGVQGGAGRRKGKKSLTAAGGVRRGKFGYVSTYNTGMPRAPLLGYNTSVAVGRMQF